MKLVIIGAGSAFGSRISIDVLSREPLNDSEIVLCDIDEPKLETVRTYVQKAIDHHGLPATVVAGTDRRKLLPGADFVIISVSIGGPAYYDQPYENEMDIPWKYGVYQAVGDTVGPGGIFRALRTAPELIAMCHDIAEFCPGATIINYTNPMAILTWVINETVDQQAVGLCHGVQGTSKHIAARLNVPYEELRFACAGINHMAWFTRLEHRGEDLYPRLRELARILDAYEKDPTRLEMLKHFGFYCTESSRHTLEYVPYFQHDQSYTDRFRDTTRGVKGRRQGWFKDMGVKIADADSIELIRSHEYASGIMEAMVDGGLFRLNGNVMNDRLITNLPQGQCVEVLCLTDGEGIHPTVYGDLPPQCAALCRTNMNTQELTAKACLERSRDAAFHALTLDPITSRALPLPRIRDLFDEMWNADRCFLDSYK